MSEQDYHFLSEAGREDSDLPTQPVDQRMIAPTPDILPAMSKTCARVLIEQTRSLLGWACRSIPPKLLFER